jgi:DNA-binding CsgD family transcriptional regulator
MIVLPPGTTVGDNLGVRQIVELFAAAVGASWARLELCSRYTEHRQTITCGEPAGPSTSIRLEISDDVIAELIVDRGSVPAERLLGQLTESLRRELHRWRLLAENTLLRSGLEATSAAVLLFGSGGQILYANGPADRLLSKQTEDELTVDWNHEGPQPLFRLLLTRVEKVLSGGQPRRWSGRLSLSDGSEMASEVVLLETGADGLGPMVFAVLREIGLPPDRRIADFASEHRLSPREREVLRLLVQGYDTAGLAECLGISPHTVRDHLKHVFRKTSSRSRSELLSAIAGTGNG